MILPENFWITVWLTTSHKTSGIPDSLQMSETSSARPSLGPGLLIQRSLQGTVILHLNSHKEHHLFAPSAPIHARHSCLTEKTNFGTWLSRRSFGDIFKICILLGAAMGNEQIFSGCAKHGSQLNVVLMGAEDILAALSMSFCQFRLWMHSLIICFIFAVFEILPWIMVQVCLGDQRCSISPLQSSTASVSDTHVVAKHKCLRYKNCAV